MNLPDDIDLTENRDFSDEFMIRPRNPKVPSKKCPWIDENDNIYISNSIGTSTTTTNTISISFNNLDAINRLYYTSNQIISNDNDVSWRISYNQSNNGTRYFTYNSSGYILTEEESLPLTPEEYALMQLYIDMPFSRKFVDRKIQSDEISSPVKQRIESEISDISSYKIEVTSLEDEITRYNFKELLADELLRTGLWMRRIFTEDDDEIKPKIIPW